MPLDPDKGCVRGRRRCPKSPLRASGPRRFGDIVEPVFAG